MAILKLALMKFGVGKWKEIVESECLPGKLIQQLNGQTQRLMGQQSLAGAQRTRRTPTPARAGACNPVRRRREGQAISLPEELAVFTMSASEMGAGRRGLAHSLHRHARGCGQGACGQ